MEAHALRAGAHGRRSLPPRLRRIAGDDKLVALVRAGDAGAFEAIFDRYRAAILSFCRHMLGSAEEAEDAVQQSFFSAYNGILGNDRPIQLRPWLYTIARNQCLTLLRARREQASLEDFEPSVDGLAAQVQQRADLREMLHDVARLPEDQRAALVLAELGDLSHTEIADVVGCPQGKVKALVFQARSSLSASREARNTSCADIREQLSTLMGGSLRRTSLRRHLHECAGCRDFQAEVRRQRQAMAILLPVVPSAGLKSGVLSSLGLTGAGTGAAVGGGGLATIVSSGAAKVAVAAAVAATGIGGGIAAVRAVDHQRATTAPVVTPAAGSTAAATRQALTGAGTSTGFQPTRAGGTFAPGRQAAGGVANGQNPKGAHGRSLTAPGRAGTSPGRAGTSPGRAGTTPGRSGTAPRRSRTTSPGTRRGTTRRRTPTPTQSGGGSGGGANPSPSTGSGSGTPRGTPEPGPVLPDVGRVVPKITKQK
jgi:RNA polymerase sigma factor (sigma-70 family)